MRLTAVLTSLVLFLCLAGATKACERPTARPRIAVVSAFPPEWQAIKAMVEHPRSCRINGAEFLTGRIEGHRVVVFLSGISMVNAAMTTQLALDRFNIDRFVFSGVAGGADPGLGVGDVAVPERWGEYLEIGMGRETPTGFTKPPFLHDNPFPNYGMIFPNTVMVGNATHPVGPKFWFDADPAMLAIARDAAETAKLGTCTARGECLDRQPKVVVGGNGVSGSAFVDNAKFREFAFSTFQARVLDMESAALAHVAYVNDKPFIVFRSLSDLAGGGASPNQIRTFMDLASGNSAELVRLFLKKLPR